MGVGISEEKLAELKAALAAERAANANNPNASGGKKGSSKGGGGKGGGGNRLNSPGGPGGPGGGGGGSKGGGSSRKAITGTYDPLLGPRVNEAHGVRYDPYDPWNESSASVLRRYEHLIGVSPPVSQPASQSVGDSVS